MFPMLWKEHRRQSFENHFTISTAATVVRTSFSPGNVRTRGRFGLISALAIGSILLNGCGEDRKPDAIPPAAVTDLRTEEVERNAITLLWTAPGDDGASGRAVSYEIRHHDAEITLSGWDSTGTVTAQPPASPAGAPESLRVESLRENERYYFALRAVDEVGNWSALSNLLSVRTASSDSIAPAEVSTLVLVRAAAREAVIAWIAPGDDSSNGRAAAYELRLAQEALTLQNWDSTGTVIEGARPKPPGELETRTLSDLEPRNRYFVALRTHDDAENWSGISNVLQIDTPADDTVPPRSVSDLSGRLTAIDAVELSFTAPGDDGSVGTAHAYDLRYASSPDSLQSGWERATPVPTGPPRLAGNREKVAVDSLSTHTTFYFAVRASDEAGLWSDLSNIARVATSDTTCVVLADSTGDYPTITAALRDGAGCAILLGDGLYRGLANTRWPDSARPRIRSVSGDPAKCILDFEGGAGNLGTGPILEAVTLRNSTTLRLRAEGTPEILEATDCVFDEVAFEAVGPFAAGPRVILEGCLLTAGTVSPLFNVDRFLARSCRFENNNTRLVIAREVEIESSSFTGNFIPSGALLRTFHDLARGSLLRVTNSRFVQNDGTLLGPSNGGRLMVEGTLFVENTESTIDLVGQTEATVRTCTFARNSAPAGSCIFTEALTETLRIERTLWVDNRDGDIVESDEPILLAVSCSDAYANEAGDWVGSLEGFLGRARNISVDPLFCDPGNDDLFLRLLSPCAPDSQPDCGRIGALDVGCR